MSSDGIDLFVQALSLSLSHICIIFWQWLCSS
uniref:Uncharacterized protein n=1 Tax=Arundo donax TaxID=35708 RepID=A0A0A9EN06_ARUDO